MTRTPQLLSSQGQEQKFSARVDEWVRATKQRQTAVFRDSCQRVLAEMQKSTAKGGNMPVDTGNLRNSLLGSTSEVPVMRDEKTATEDQVVLSLDVEIPPPVELTIAKLELGDTFYAGYTANYARDRHYMNTDMPGGMWRDLAVQRWPEFVNASARDLRRRVTGG
jgi:hypothetical protein